MSKDAFGELHPLVGFVFFTLVLLCSMLLMHPLCLGISLVGAACYTLWQRGRRAVRQLRTLLPLMVGTALLNPLFSRVGATLVWYPPWGGVVTLEALAYGAAAASMLAAVLGWFGCHNRVMTSDKLLYLFGRVTPGLALVLSMTLGFVPRFRQQLGQVVQAQRGVGRDPSRGPVLQRAGRWGTVLSVMLTWSLQNAMDTAQSMTSRGHGLPGRTSYTIHTFGRRDAAVLTWLLLGGAYLFLGILTGGLEWQYFPTLRGVPLGPRSISLFFCYLGLCLTPVILNLWEAYQWTSTQSDT